MNDTETTYFARSRNEPIVGKSSQIGNGAFLDCQGPITIGNFVFFGHEVMILTGTHDYMLTGRERMQNHTARPVTIEDGVWVCSRAIICPGVTIGHDAVVAAGAVVMRNVAPFTLVGGNPARRIRKLQ